ncbi:MAG: diguanylate cyclase [Deltaproteobacteria bacterium]|nr:diguanylate cyclase [Deltaproteobacteria bacterium]
MTHESVKPGKKGNRQADFWPMIKNGVWPGEISKFFVKRATARLFRLNIAKKMLLGYLLYAASTILIALFTLSRLEQLNMINNSIIKRDIPLVEITDKMIDTLLAQELYGRRSMILDSPDMSALFWARSKEFENLIRQMDALPQRRDIPLDRVIALHKEYNHLFQRSFKLLKNPSSPSGKKYDQEIKAKQEQLVQLLKRVSREARQAQNEKSLMTYSVGKTAFQITAILCTVGLLLGIVVALIITRNIARPINQLRISTQEISEGKFDRLPIIRNRDELGDLSQAFEEMAKRLKRLEEMYLDASPLTRLPGGVAIENIIKKRLLDGSSLAFCLLDLANFKSFNDRYGYARGNEVIQETARIITHAVGELGGEEDFIGHIGGDDFVITTAADRYEKICRAIIEAFDKEIINFYDPEDKQRGYILGKTRQGKKISFPIMTLSIAVVTNQMRRLQNYIHVGEIAAELKNYAKSFSRSIYVVDRRKDKPVDS